MRGIPGWPKNSTPICASDRHTTRQWRCLLPSPAKSSVNSSGRSFGAAMVSRAPLSDTSDRMHSRCGTAHPRSTHAAHCKCLLVLSRSSTYISIARYKTVDSRPPRKSPNAYYFVNAENSRQALNQRSPLTAAFRSRVMRRGYVLLRMLSYFRGRRWIRPYLHPSLPSTVAARQTVDCGGKLRGHHALATRCGSQEERPQLFPKLPLT